METGGMNKHDGDVQIRRDKGETAAHAHAMVARPMGTAGGGSRSPAAAAAPCVGPGTPPGAPAPAVAELAHRRPWWMVVVTGVWGLSGAPAKCVSISQLAFTFPLPSPFPAVARWATLRAPRTRILGGRQQQHRAAAAAQRLIFLKAPAGLRRGQAPGCSRVGGGCADERRRQRHKFLSASDRVGAAPPSDLVRRSADLPPQCSGEWEEGAGAGFPAGQQRPVPDANQWVQRCCSALAALGCAGSMWAGRMGMGAAARFCIAVAGPGGPPAPATTSQAWARRR